MVRVGAIAMVAGSLLLGLAVPRTAFSEAHRVAAAIAGPPPGGVDAGAGPRPDAGPSGYAQSFAVLNAQTRAFEQDPQNHYTYCIRTTATYECLSYGVDGQIHKAHPQSVAHGTGVAYQQVNGETYLLTNQHVAEWPLVTDAAHTASDIPNGCKLLATALKIVDNDHDDYEPDDIPLIEVVSDVALDAAIVKAKGSLRTIPYAIGHSSDLRVGDVVVAKGFPLGVFRAITSGQVINTYDHDETGDWNHDDFIVDAPLSEGNSGSPVMAVSNRTGEYEMVGLFHAHYVDGQSLNAVIGIEQLRDLMTTLKKTPRSVWAERRGPADQRADFLHALDKPSFVPFFQLGAREVEVRRVGDTLVYQLYSPEFPRDGWRDLLVVDRPLATGWGTISEVWVAVGPDFAPVERAALSAPLQSTVAVLERRLHALSNDTLTFRTLRSQSGSSRQALAQFEQFRRQVTKAAGDDPDLSEAVGNLVAELSAHPAAPAIPIDQVWIRLTPPAPPIPAAPVNAPAVRSPIPEVPVGLPSPKAPARTLR